MIEIRHISASTIFCDPGFGEISEQYCEESLIKGFNPSPQLEHYQALEQMGVIQILGAFDGEALIGFMTVLITKVPHYEAPLASAESFFVLKAYRKSGAGLKLLREAESIARERGVNHFAVSAPIDGQLDKAMAITKGYKATNRVYVRVFDE